MQPDRTYDSYNVLAYSLDLEVSHTDGFLTCLADSRAVADGQAEVRSHWIHKFCYFRR